VPLGPSNKPVKGGSDIVWALKGGVGSPFLLKGYRNEFYRYDIVADSWQALSLAPVGANIKWDKGSWLAGDDANNVIYAFKAKYMELYRYSPNGDSWSRALAPMPRVGLTGNKKAKDGSCGTFVGGNIYALKGGNTQQFFEYAIAADSWAERETIPRGTYKKKVKAGADIVTVGATLYATKGNKSNELWMYTPAVYWGKRGLSRAESDAGAPGDCPLFSVSPNPLASDFATVSFTGPRDHLTTRPLALSLFDISGRRVLYSSFDTRNSSLCLDLRSLPSGVYLIRLTGDGCDGSQKLVVQR